MDYKNHKVGLNIGNTKANEDGSYTIYLSHKPMDVDNWISTANYKEAIIFCRWLLAEELPEQPTVELLKSAKIWPVRSYHAALCLNTDKAFRGNKKGTIHQNLELSPLVAQKGQKSNLFKDFEALLIGLET